MDLQTSVPAHNGKKSYFNFHLDPIHVMQMPTGNSRDKITLLYAAIVFKIWVNLFRFKNTSV
jgi:hypothetical protein